jgi:septum formation protein
LKAFNPHSTIINHQPSMDHQSQISNPPMPPVRLVLASASPRRAELLTAAGFEFDIDPVHVDESRQAGETPAAYVERVARSKAAAGGTRHPSRVVVGADTVVVLEDDVLGKPRDEADARAMLRRLSGRSHEVMTAIAVASNGGRLRGESASASQDLRAHVERTTVWFRALSDQEIEWYVRSGEPMDKAGAYAIQGLAARFIPRIDGSYSNVVGLPLAALADLVSGS